MTGIILYFSIVQYCLFAYTFIAMYRKGYIYNNYFGLIPFVGSKSTFIWLILSHKVEMKNKKDREKEAEKHKCDNRTMKMQVIFKQLFKWRGNYNGRYYDLPDWEFSDYINRFNRFEDSAINSELFKSINNCLNIFNSAKSNKVSELFLNMIDTLCGIFQVDEETRISDDTIQEIIELCDNYHNVMKNIIEKEKVEVEENIKRKSEKYNHYVKGKIQNITTILKEVDKDMNYVIK